jgi:hypothetical protein
MFGGRSFIIGVLFYSVVSLAIILFASPLFAVIGFEFATVISLATSIHLLFYTAQKSATLPKGKFTQTLKSIYVPIALFLLLPFCIGVVNGLLINQCDLLLGIVMYVQVVIPTAIIAVLFGIHYGWMKPKTSRRVWVSVFWVVTFVVSLIPGYLNPQIFTYGWQYGFFPGFIWDAAMELQPAYWWSRLCVLLFAVSFLVEDYQLIKAGAKTREERVKVRQANFWRVGVFINTPIVICLLLLPQIGIIRSHRDIKRELRKTINIKNSVIIHCTDSTFTNEELTLLQYKCSLYCDSIRLFFNITDKRLTHLYIYPSNEQMKKFVGTSSASIAKPWMNELHIAKENLGSLKHELVHTLLAPYGNYPFDISWSTGLTEGAAVAVEENYDGIRDCDDYAARILQLGLAQGVKEVMSFSGFAAQASGKSYTLAGSFSKYLIKQYGSEKFLSLYNTRNYDGIYGKPVEALEREWIVSLRALQTPMDRYDSLRVHFYFDRTSIINEPCLRRIGRLMKQASEYFADSMYKQADAVYAEVLQESDRLDAIRGRVFSHLRMNDPQAALKILDTLPAAQIESNRAALHNLKGDCIFFATGDTAKAKAEWMEAMNLELSDRSVITGYIRYYFLSRISPEIARKYLTIIYNADKVNIETIIMMSQFENAEVDVEFGIGVQALLFRLSDEIGELKQAKYSAEAIVSQRERYFSTSKRASMLLIKYCKRFLDVAKPAFEQDLQ